MNKGLPTADLSEIIHKKNDLIIKQTRRINMLEEKLNDVRQKYFRLKAQLQYGEKAGHC